MRSVAEACLHRPSEAGVGASSWLKRLAARAGRLAALLFLALGLAALGAAERPANAQSSGSGSGSCSSASNCSVTGTTSTGTPFSATYNPTTNSGTFTLDSQAGQSFTVTQTSSTTFIGTAAAGTVNCTFTSSTNFTCSELAPGSTSGQSGSSQSTLKGTEAGTTRAQVESSFDIILSRITSYSRDIAGSLGSNGQQSEAPGYYRGISAGSADLKWGFWADSSGSYLKDSSTVANFNGYGLTELTGVDYNLGNKWLLGFNAGYVRTDVRVAAIGGDRLEQGPQFGPYLSYIASSHVTADLLFNYSRLSNAAAGFASFNSNRYAGAGNINFFYDVSGFALTGFMGYTYAIESPSSVAPGLIGGVPTFIHYGAIKVGGEAAYPMGNFEPYVPLTVEYETTQTHDGTGRGVVVIGAGARYRFTDSVKGGIEVTSDEARTHSTNVVGAANLRISF